MAEKTTFILGNLSADFMQMKTSDNVYLKDIVANITDTLDIYNSRQQALTSIFCRLFDDASSNRKLVYINDGFAEVGETEGAPNRSGAEVWNYPIPIRRFGASTGISMEQLKKMSSADVMGFHNGKLLADKKNIITKMFQAMTVKSPTAYVDALDGKALSAKAFWNADGVDVPRPNGQITFANTHNHYNVVAGADNTYTVTDLKAAIAHITEHEGMGGGVQLVTFARTGTTLNYLKALSEFRSIVEIPQILSMVNPAYQQSGIVQALVTGGQVLGDGVKVVGTALESIIVETPDLPAGYVLTVAFRLGAKQAPLGWREHPAFKGLWLMDPNYENPIIGKGAQYRRWLGLGVEDRSAGHVHYTISGASGTNTWAEPTFA